MPSKGLDGRNARAGLLTDCLEQSWWPQQAKVDARLGFIPSALIQTSPQYLEVHQYRVRGDSWWHDQHASAFALDVSINKPFKDRMRAKWQNWMLAGQHSFTAGGHIRKVELDEICRWISDVWDDIPTEMIAKSFRKCCITNALDGTEDEEIWEEESDSDPFEDLDKITSDDQLYYADNFEQQQAEIEPECFENIFFLEL